LQRNLWHTAPSRVYLHHSHIDRCECTGASHRSSDRAGWHQRLAASCLCPGGHVGQPCCLPFHLYFGTQELPQRFVLNYPLPSSWERRVAASTAAISAARSPRSSRAARPAIVVPPGLATLSLREAGCSAVVRTISAAPRTVWAAKAAAMSLGNPIF